MWVAMCSDCMYSLLCEYFLLINVSQSAVGDTCFILFVSVE